MVLKNFCDWYLNKIKSNSDLMINFIKRVFACIEFPFNEEKIN